MLYGENFMACCTTLSVVIWFSTGTLGSFATLVYLFTMRVVIYDILTREPREVSVSDFDETEIC